MKISQDTKNVIEYLSSVSGSLKMAKDLATILETCAQNNLSDELNELIFQGSSFFKLYKLLNSNNKKAPDETLKLEGELISITNSYRNILEKIIKYVDSKPLTAKYLSLSDESIANLRLLSVDLFAMKEVQNKNRRD